MRNQNGNWSGHENYCTKYVKKDLYEVCLKTITSQKKDFQNKNIRGFWMEIDVVMCVGRMIWRSLKICGVKF